jgi:hypothetical protein
MFLQPTSLPQLYILMYIALCTRTTVSCTAQNNDKKLEENFNHPLEFERTDGKVVSEVRLHLV